MATNKPAVCKMLNIGFIKKKKKNLYKGIHLVIVIP